jgi:hypothetical protein
MGDVALGVVNAHHYSAAHPSAVNKKFVADFMAANKFRPNFMAVGGYDGMRVIYKALEASKGAGGDALLAGMKGQLFESPRGQVLIDAQTRDIVHDMYIRKVEKKDGQLWNIEFDSIKAMKDPGKKVTFSLSPQGEGRGEGNRAPPNPRETPPSNPHPDGLSLGGRGELKTRMLTLLFDGIAYGMLLFVLSLGLAVTMGLMNFINLAHGAFAMAGGYVLVLLMQRGLALPGLPAGGLRVTALARRRAGAHALPADVRQAAPRPGAVLDRPDLHGRGRGGLRDRLAAEERADARVAARPLRDRQRCLDAGHGPLPAVHHRVCVALALALQPSCSHARASAAACARRWTTRAWPPAWASRSTACSC